MVMVIDLWLFNKLELLHIINCFSNENSICFNNIYSKYGNVTLGFFEDVINVSFQFNLLTIIINK